MVRAEWQEATRQDVDPIEQITLLISNLEAALLRFRQALADERGREALLGHRMTEFDAQRKAMRDDAETALLADREDLARRALEEAQKLDELMLRLQQRKEASASMLAKLQAELAEYEAQLKEATITRELLLLAKPDPGLDSDPTVDNPSTSAGEMDHTLSACAKALSGVQAYLEKLEGKTTADLDLEKQFDQLRTEAQLAKELEQLKTSPHPPENLKPSPKKSRRKTTKGSER